MKTSRREFIKRAILISASAALGLDGKTAFTSSEKQSLQLSEKLYVYNWPRYIAESTIPDFEKEYGVKIIYHNYSSNEELLAKVRASATVYDLIFPSEFMVDIMIKEGLLDRLELANIPNFRNVEKNFTNLPFDPGNIYSVPYLWGTTGIGFNTEKVEERVDSWVILWDERYRGRISMLNDMRGIANPALKLFGYGINTTDPEEIEQAKQLLIKQKPLVRFYTSDAYVELLESGDIWLCQGYTGDIFQAMKQNESIKYAIPREGTDMWMDNICIPGNARSKYTAEIFINYLLRPEVSAEISNFTWYASPNSAAHEFIKSEILSNPAIYPPKEILDKCEFQRDVGEEATTMYKQLLDEVTSGQVLLK